MSTAVEEKTEKQVETGSKTIGLTKLTLTNFKGVKAFAFMPSADGAVVRGDNGTGKTTLADAFMWLLFNKDSQGKSDFEIKALDKFNNPLHHLDHTVEATLDVAGKAVVLKKVYKEKWTKKRGSLQADLTSHTTDYYIDEVPKPKREYEARIKEIIEEETFKLLTSPTYFNDLHWTKRRDTLLAICGDIADSEVIGSNPDLEDLKAVLGDRPMADHQKVVSARKSVINKRLTEIPARIDELTKSLSDAEGDPEYIKREIDMLDKDLSQIKTAGAGTFDADILKLNNERTALISKRDREREDKATAIRREITELEDKKEHAARKLQSISNSIVDTNTRIGQKENDMASLRRKPRSPLC